MMNKFDEFDEEPIVCSACRDRKVVRVGEITGTCEETIAPCPYCVENSKPVCPRCKHSADEHELDSENTWGECHYNDSCSGSSECTCPGFQVR